MTAAAEEIPSILTFSREEDELMRIENATFNELLDEAQERFEDLASSKVARDTEARLNSNERAEVTKELLFIAHLVEKAKLSVMDEYYRFKGETAHLIGGRRR